MHPETGWNKTSHHFVVQAPTDGVVQPLSLHPNAAIRQLAGFGFCLQASSQPLFSPCAGLTSVHFLPHPCIRLKHPSGLQLRLDLPLAWLDRCGQGIRWQLDQRPVTAGQPLLEIDPAYLTGKSILSVAVFPHPAIQPELVPSGTTVLAKEPCFFIQLTGKNP